MLSHFDAGGILKYASSTTASREPASTDFGRISPPERRRATRTPRLEGSYARYIDCAVVPVRARGASSIVSNPSLYFPRASPNGSRVRQRGFWTRSSRAPTVRAFLHHAYKGV